MNAMQAQLVSLLAGGGTLVGIFAAAVLAARREGDAGANHVLSALMVLFSLSIIYPLFFQAWPALMRTHAVLVLEPFQFLIPPLMAWYFRVLLLPGYRLRPSQFLHALPFVLFGLVSVVPMPSSAQRPAHVPAAAVTEILWALLVLQAFLYLIPSLRLLFRYRHSLRDQESNIAGLDLGWLMWFGHLFLAMNTAYAFLLIIMLHGPREFPVREYLSMALSILVFAIGQRALLQKRTPAIEGLDVTAPAADAREGRTVVQAVEAAGIKARLVRAMETEELYLNPELRLSDLVGRLGVTRNQLSYVINKHLGKNFYDFVNEYRIRRVLRLMNEQTYDDKKIIAMAFDAGFNSKPAFNAVFKKYTGLTPSAYRDGKKKLSHASP
ncbi:MAG: helix-turn-helix domain-containing protein [Spirochaetia bacterium]